MTSVTIPHRVPPKPNEASHTSRGAWASTSRVTDVMMGMMVTAQIKPQAKIDWVYRPGEGVRRMGTNPTWSTSHLAGAACRLETTSSPQKPYTMLGTVASRSMTAVSQGFSRRARTR